MVTKRDTMQPYAVVGMVFRNLKIRNMEKAVHKIFIHCDITLAFGAHVHDCIFINSKVIVLFTDIKIDRGGSVRNCIFYGSSLTIKFEAGDDRDEWFTLCTTMNAQQFMEQYNFTMYRSHKVLIRNNITESIEGVYGAHYDRGYGYGNRGICEGETAWSIDDKEGK